MTSRPRAADVARRAGVSVTAVSFVFSGRDVGNVAPATKERILLAAAELGYRPHRVAQSLRRQRTHVIGLVTDSIASSPFGGRVLGGAVERAALDDYVVVIFDSQGHEDREQAAVAEFEARQVDGLVYATMGLRKLATVPETHLPLVLANCFQEPDQHPSVIPDDERGGREAARILLEAGHRRLLMINGPGPNKTRRGGNLSGPLRAKGFRATARAASLSREDAVVVTAGWQIADGYAAAMRVLGDEAGRARPAYDRPSAVFAVTDRVATGVLLAAARLHLEVPGDLSLIGYDDQEALADQVVPGLTTLALPHAAMGRRAVDLLIARFGEDGRGAAGPASRELLTCPLVTRGTVGPPR